MGYFQSTNLQCSRYPQEWNQVLDQIIGWSSPNPISQQIAQPLEAKALYVFTIARRLTRAAYLLGQSVRDWKQIFIEASILLFPMLELLGYSRLDDRQVSKYYTSSDTSSVNLWAGLHWLRDPSWPPAVKDNRQKTDTIHLHRWQIGHLVILRHYLLHGSKNATDRKGNLLPIQDIINYELPGFIIRTAQPAMTAYWSQLKRDNGNQGWLERLARADIRPLPIQGSGTLEKCLIDDDIVDFQGNINVLRIE